MNENNLDQIFQNAVDEEAKKFFSYSTDKLFSQNDYGSIEIINQGININIGWWKWKCNESQYHIVFQAERKWILGFYNKYLNGIKFDMDSCTVEYLSSEELGNYD